MKKNVRFLWFHDLLLQPWFSNRSHCFPFYSVSHEVYSRIYFVSKYAWKLFLTAFENTYRGWWWLISPLSFPLQSPSAVRSNFTTLCTLGTIIDRRSNFSIFNSTCHQQPLQRSRRPLTRGRRFRSSKCFLSVWKFFIYLLHLFDLNFILHEVKRSSWKLCLCFLPGKIFIF